jgi:hypothetical protein
MQNAQTDTPGPTRCSTPAAAGAPAPNATFFCDSNATYCYSLRTVAANYSTATDICNSANGTLVEYDSAASQVSCTQMSAPCSVAPWDATHAAS